MRGIFLLLLLSVRIPAIYIYLNDIGLIGTSFFFQVPIENKKTEFYAYMQLLLHFFAFRLFVLFSIFRKLYIYWHTLATICCAVLS